jgi:hypothetical protein
LRALGLVFHVGARHYLRMVLTSRSFRSFAATATVAAAVVTGATAWGAKLRTQDIKAGMPAERVLELLGQPKNRSFRERQEAWQYSRIASFGVCEYVTIWIDHDVVYAMNTDRTKAIGGCNDAPHIDWGQHPPPTINVNVHVDP